MKTAQDPRHQKRITCMQKLFSASFGNTPDQEIAHIWSTIPRIDPYITTSAPDWPINKIARIDLAILRLAVYELLIENTEPEKVIVDEAVELAKSFGNTTSASFINGALGGILEHIKKAQTMEEQP